MYQLTCVKNHFYQKHLQGTNDKLYNNKALLIIYQAVF